MRLWPLDGGGTTVNDVGAQPEAPGYGGCHACLPPLTAPRYSAAGRGMVLNEAGCCRNSCPCHSAREVLTAGAVASRPGLGRTGGRRSPECAPVHADDRLARRAQWLREQ